MDKARRKILTDASSLIEQAKELIMIASTEERDYRDNMPEAFQGTDKYEIASNNADVLEDAANDIDTMLDGINEVIAT